MLPDFGGKIPRRSLEEEGTQMSPFDPAVGDNEKLTGRFVPGLAAPILAIFFDRKGTGFASRPPFPHLNLVLPVLGSSPRATFAQNGNIKIQVGERGADAFTVPSCARL